MIEAFSRTWISPWTLLLTTGWYTDNGLAALLLGGLSIVLVVLAAWFVRQWWKREPVRQFTESMEIERSVYEPVLSELTGIKLRIEGGEGRTALSKISRLVRVFLGRAGVPDAAEKPVKELRKSMSEAHLTEEECTALGAILERCERASEQESVRVDFDPLELIEEVRSIITRIEGRAAH